MRLPKSLETLADHGVIEEVLRPLMSGKEAQIYLVVAEGQVCAAKIYKDAQIRSFQNRADYVEGRKVRNRRDQRAMSKGTKYGKARDEDAWRSTEVEMIYRLRAAGVRVPEPHVYIDGVLLMELVQDPDGNPAPRLGDLNYTEEEATHIYDILIAQTMLMLCAGVVHGDLSDFNVLLAWDGPVFIDFPQSVNAAGNQNARALFLRDVNNLHRFAARFIRGFRRRPYGEEMWALYEENRLTPETQLTGRFQRGAGPVDTKAVEELIADANRDEMRRRGTPETSVPSAAPAPRRREVIVAPKPQRGAAGHHRTTAAPGRGPGTTDRGTSSHAGSGPRPRTSEGGRGGYRSGEREGGGGRGSHGHAGAPGGGQRGPRGDARDGGRRGPEGRASKPAPKKDASAYVSPEARKVKTLKLTPRVTPTSSEADKRGPAPEKNGRREGTHRDRPAASGQAGQAGQQGDRPARRRRRRRRAPGEGSAPKPA